MENVILVLYERVVIIKSANFSTACVIIPTTPGPILPNNQRVQATDREGLDSIWTSILTKK